MALNHYTKVYDNFLSDNVCDQYVRCFEETMVKDRAEVIDTSICYGKEVGAAGQPICGNCNSQRMNPMVFDRFIPEGAIFFLPKTIDLIDLFLLIK